MAGAAMFAGVASLSTTSRGTAEIVETLTFAAAAKTRTRLNVITLDSCGLQVNTEFRIRAQDTTALQFAISAEIGVTAPGGAQTALIWTSVAIAISHAREAASTPGSTSRHRKSVSNPPTFRPTNDLAATSANNCALAIAGGAWTVVITIFATKINASDR